MGLFLLDYFWFCTSTEAFRALFLQHFTCTPCFTTVFTKLFPYQWFFMYGVLNSSCAVLITLPSADLKIILQCFLQKGRHFKALVTDICYLASCHSVSAFQSAGFLWTAGAWTGDLTQICFGTEWISWADDASCYPACLAMPTAHVQGSADCENRRLSRPDHSKRPNPLSQIVWMLH